ncbi:hypothetical protein [Bradyrhizobium japonicum]|uniref:hypothetical protein n=1 Tax=Bradyrhizobium japonicum TaxID=375 RepID=UPI001B8A5A19|nr:hypothetical protein [Bradyrhizobium japonicum]MBR0975577.1 hypothetical protein [Bradyrhizobium japonicum]
MTDAELNGVAAAAIASLAMGQLSVIALVQSGLLSKTEAEAHLRQLATPHQTQGGTPNRAAAQILTALADNIAAMTIQPRQ